MHHQAPPAPPRRSRFNPRLPFPGGDAAWIAPKSTSTHCFNPRLPFPGGDARLLCCPRSSCLVSIHASRFREAMPRRRGKTPNSPRGFNPRLPFPGGDARYPPRPRSIHSGFNPRLPFPGGDALIAQQKHIEQSRFNPRLPFPGGDAASEYVTGRVVIVSIHASRFREAMRLERWQLNFTETEFQSTPPVSGRRCSSLITI